MITFTSGVHPFSSCRYRDKSFHRDGPHGYTPPAPHSCPDDSDPRGSTLISNRSRCSGATAAPAPRAAPPPCRSTPAPASRPRTRKKTIKHIMTSINSVTLMCSSCIGSIARRRILQTSPLFKPLRLRQPKVSTKWTGAACQGPYPLLSSSLPPPPPATGFSSNSSATIAALFVIRSVFTR